MRVRLPDRQDRAGQLPVFPVSVPAGRPGTRGRGGGAVHRRARPQPGNPPVHRDAVRAPGVVLPAGALEPLLRLRTAEHPRQIPRPRGGAGQTTRPTAGTRSRRCSMRFPRSGASRSGCISRAVSPSRPTCSGKPCSLAFRKRNTSGTSTFTPRGSPTSSWKS
jgi:hypothetical protein